MLVISAQIHKMIVRIANREDFEQTVSSESVWSSLCSLPRPFWQATCVQILEHLRYTIDLLINLSFVIKQHPI